jgi:hypothetical protein
MHNDSVISYGCLFDRENISVYAAQISRCQVFQILLLLVFLAMGYMQRQGFSHRAIGTSHGNPLTSISESVQCREMMGVEGWLT